LNCLSDLHVSGFRRIFSRIVNQILEAPNPNKGQGCCSDSEDYRYGCQQQNYDVGVTDRLIGLYEIDSFATGTKSLFKEIAKSKAITIIGGGDTIDAITKFKISPKKFTHVSTGGGAMIEFLEGRTLPGIVPLIKK
jgi:hypothetical protein